MKNERSSLLRDKKGVDRYLLFILLGIGLIWLKSGLGKLAMGNFADTLGGTLVKFMAKNPYPWFVDFINSWVLPSSSMWGLVVMTSEALAGILITFAALALMFVGGNEKRLVWALKVGIIIGFGLSLMFLLAAGWTSPSTDGLNQLMLVVEGIGVIYAWSLLKKS